MAASAPARAQPSPGWWVIWKLAHCLMSLSNVIDPAPFGSFMVSPGRSRVLSSSPFESVNFFILEVSSWYTFCGIPESTPRLPWYADSARTG